jgi:hypothetical protein
MLQACYTVGGLSISAAEIEFVILKMKAPVHRPQLVLLSPSFATSSINYTSQNGFYLFTSFQSLMLAPHKFKTSEKLKKYSIDDTEHLVLFALSCGMFSSPAVSERNDTYIVLYLPCKKTDALDVLMYCSWI